MSRFDDKGFRKEYNRLYKIKRKRQIKRYNSMDLVVKPSIFQFKGTDQDEPIVCSYFGCNKILTPEERLYGTRCISCQPKVKADATFYVSHPSKKSA